MGTAANHYNNPNTPIFLTLISQGNICLTKTPPPHHYDTNKTGETFFYKQRDPSFYHKHQKNKKNESVNNMTHQDSMIIVWVFNRMVWMIKNIMFL